MKKKLTQEIELEDVLNTPFFGTNPEHFEFISKYTNDDLEFILEFGVFKGTTINIIANIYPNNNVFGFDSFEGLPEAWDRGNGSVYKPGHFKLDSMPPVLSNVNLIKGFFDNSLNKWLSLLEESNKTIKLLHIDVDLYSSAKYVLDALNHMIIKDTIVVFDELHNERYHNPRYVNWKDGEWKALNEWTLENCRQFEFISHSRGSSALKITK